MKETIKTKVDEDVTEQNPCSNRNNSRTWQLWSCGSTVKDRIKGLWNLPRQLKKTTEVRNVSVVSLNGGLERPMCQAVKVKPELFWVP